MAKIVRFNGNLVPFASSSLGTERTLFGSVSQANDITSQYTASFLRGWGIVGPSDQPTLQDFNAVSYTHGQILSYLHQMGLPEYDAAQEYHIGSVTQRSGEIYLSLQNTNIGNSPEASPTFWRRNGTTSTELSFTTPGVSAWVVPLGVSRVYVRIIGGGGGGGTRTAAQPTGAAGGGGGGGICERWVNVTPGQSINVTVGAAGLGATSASTPGGNGGASSLGAFGSASGGTGGGVFGGGGGGVGSGGTLNTSSGPGFPSATFSNSAEVNSGHTGAGGGAGGAATTFSGATGATTGAAAIGPGGGGAGAFLAANGGNGFRGQVDISW